MARASASIFSERSGLTWFFLDPLLRFAIYGLFFGSLLSESAKPDNFIPALLIGISVFYPFQTAISRGIRVIQESRAVQQVTGVSATETVLSYVVEILVKGSVYLALTIGVLIFAGSPPTFWWIFVPVFYVILSAPVTVFLLLFGALGNTFKGFKRLGPSISRVLFYSSGVFWSLTKVLPESGFVSIALQANPIYLAIEIMRELLLKANPQPWALVLDLTVSTLFLLALSSVFFFWAKGRE